ncbi:MAG: hypothetical protein HRT88_01820 [Lentisphaeraceae bacterium]|nr:hypothetical protein [Lentisphaeraceae bacterium]
MYLERTLENSQELKQVDEALTLGRKLKLAIRQLEKESPQNVSLGRLKLQFQKYEEQMYRSYGLVPGLTYMAVPLSGKVFQIIPVAEINKYRKAGFLIADNSPVVKVNDARGKAVACVKVMLKVLSKSVDIQYFKKAVASAESLRMKVMTFSQRMSVDEKFKKEEKLQSALKQLRQSLKTIENAIYITYGVRAEGKYSFEPDKGAIYLVLSEDDLKELADFKKGR